MTTRACDACRARPVRDTRTVCDQCAWQVVRDLKELPGLVDELWLTFTRQTRTGWDGGLGRQTLPGMMTYNLRVAELRDETVAMLHAWTVTVLGGNPAHWPTTEWLQPMCRVLADSMDLIARRDDAARMHRDVADTTQKIKYVVDRPADKLYAGVCGATVQPGVSVELGDGTARGSSAGWRCDQSLYAKPGSPTVTCRDCGARHDVAGRRDRMLAELDDMLLPAADIARLVTYLGDLGVARHQTRKLINQWHARGRLAQRGRSPAGAPRFRFGEVLALLARNRGDG